MKKVAIIGAGHNGLVAACYLGRAGFDVTVFETRDRVGGLASTEELFPGIRSSSLASWYGMMRPEIVRDFALNEKTKCYVPEYNSMHLSSDEHLLFYKNMRHDVQARFFLKNFSEDDQKQWNTYWAQLHKASAIFHDNMLDVSLTKEKYQNILAENGLKDVADDLFEVSLLDYTRKNIRNDSLVATIMNMSFDHPSAKGSLFEIIYLGSANALGLLGRLGFIEGGIGRVSEVLAEEASNQGVRIQSNTKVSHIKNKEIFTNDGDVSFGRFDLILSSVDPLTLGGLLTGERCQETKFVGSKAVVHLKISDLPYFPVFEKIGRVGDKQHEGSMNFSSKLEDYDVFYRYLEKNEFYQPGVTISSHIPTTWDANLRAQNNKSHLWTLVHHYVPSYLNGKEWDEDGKKQILNSTLEHLKLHVKNIDHIIEDSLVITPTDLERKYGVATRNCAHLPMSDEFSFEKRFPNVAGSFLTEYQDIYTCGAGAFPSGTQSGAPGYLCAQEIIRKFGRS
jgi:phytoene dehydrogenase-like protein